MHRPRRHRARSRANSPTPPALLTRGEEAVRHLRRRRALFRGRERVARLLREARGFRWPKRRPANRRCRPIIRWPWAPSASPAPAAANKLAAEADVILARRHAASPISPPAPGRCSRIPTAASSASTCSPSTRPSIARCRWSPTPAPASPRSTRRSATGRAPTRWGEAAARPRPNGTRPRRAIPRRPTPPLPSDAQVLGALHARGRAERHRRLRRGRPARRIAQALAGRARRSAITSNTAIPAWAMRSPAGSASSWRMPDREVVVALGDGSYLMMNSEIATSVMLGLKLIIVVNDNRGFGCINRLQRATGGASFNNLLRDARHEVAARGRFRRACRARWARGASRSTRSPNSRTRSRRRARRDRPRSSSSTPIPLASTDAGGAWWDVAVPEVSERAEVVAARRQL